MRFFSSLRTKFTLAYSVMILLVLILMNTYILLASRDMVFESKQKLMQNQASIISTALSDLDRLTVSDVEQVMERLDIAGVHVTITGSDGGVIYGDPSGGDAGDAASSLEMALGGDDVLYTKFSSGAFFSSAFMPILRGGGIVGAVCVNEVDEAQGAILIDLQSTLKSISIIISALSVVVIVFMLLSVMRRITGILKAIASVREGEYTYRIKLTGNDELSVMGDEFNSLTKRLRETEEIRRRFVDDASHELKTPLASIRLLSDSILQNEGMDGGTVREFVNDIGHEAERLARTTEKLMSLARLDSPGAQENSLVDMRSVILNTMRMLRPLAAGSNVALDTEIEESCAVWATEDSLYQVVFNLVENAIKYNVSGGTVTVSLRREGGKCALTVDDTGIGVPEQDLPNIFDRFYRVDKARSHEAGGSGLGLSIVRDTVYEYGGTITARRRISGGMSFEVRFPLYSETD